MKENKTNKRQITKGSGVSPRLCPARLCIYQPDQCTTVTQPLRWPSALGPLCLVTSSRERGSFLQPSTWVARGLESGHLLVSANHTWEGRWHRTFPWLLSDSQRKMWGSNSNCSWDWGLSTAHRQMLDAGGRGHGRWLTMWLTISSDHGGSQFSYRAKCSKTRSQSSSSSDKVMVPLAPFRVCQTGPPISLCFWGDA